MEPRKVDTEHATVIHDPVFSIKDVHPKFGVKEMEMQRSIPKVGRWGLCHVGQKDGIGPESGMSWYADRIQIIDTMFFKKEGNCIW